MSERDVSFLDAAVHNAASPAPAPPGADDPRRRALGRWILIAAAAFLGSTAVLLGMAVSRALSGPSPLTPDPQVRGLSIPPFSMTDQDGATVTESALRGRVTVLDFIFTNCPLACPVMTQEMAALAHILEGTPVRFVSISVDPANDTPARLRDYALTHGADLTRWSFLTGDEETPKRLAQDALKFHLGADEGTAIPVAGGGVMRNIHHPTHLVLVGPRLEVLGVYGSSDERAMDALAARAASASKAAGPPAGR